MAFFGGDRTTSNIPLTRHLSVSRLRKWSPAKIDNSKVELHGRHGELTFEAAALVKRIGNSLG